MLTYERQLQIMEILRGNQVATVEQLAKTLFVSGATIRRDLAEMENKGFLSRIHGGATIFESIAKDAPLLLRTKKETEKKKMIAELAVRLVGENKIIFMDSSSTATALASLFDRFTGLSIVTNGLVTANLLNEKTGNSVYLTGGQIIGNSSVIGNFGMKMINNINADICFFSCCGVTESGTTEAKEEIALCKQLMVQNSAIRVLLCDSTKFDSAYFCHAVDMDDIDYIVTDKKPAEKYISAGKKLIY